MALALMLTKLERKVLGGFLAKQFLASDDSGGAPKAEVRSIRPISSETVGSWFQVSSPGKVSAGRLFAWITAEPTVPLEKRAVAASLSFMMNRKQQEKGKRTGQKGEDH